MDSFELKITKKDWLYISMIGALFGFLFSVFLYFLNQQLHHISTIVFGTFSALLISLISSIFITISNNYILPNLNKRFWYIISFGFSFLSGAIGFLLSYLLFALLGSYIANTIAPYSLYITIVIGFLTFLIGLILHQFISMKHNNESIKNEILQTKIKALENELNPHFLFNALNSMSELVYLDPAKAETSILNLSKFLRNAIKTDSLISIEEELDMVKNYIQIENIRFADKIKLTIKGEKNSTKIPKFSIQLLVENGIKHGFLGKELHIDIVVHPHCIVVTNDGEKIQNLELGTGLSNLSKRLEFLKVGTLEFLDTPNTTFKINMGEKNENINS